ncbi:MAG: single-stranded DNA-binding protein [Bacteroidia bacterium]|nr:single-stranded DNA-binding protein [Bacteroidia bacterium]
MNSLRNSVRLIGHLGADPDVKEVGDGKKVAKVSLATNNAYRKADGELVESVDWHNLVAWGKTAEIMEKYTAKGQEICIEGKLANRNWEDQDGKKHYMTEVIVSELLMVGKRM